MHEPGLFLQNKMKLLLLKEGRINLGQKRLSDTHLREGNQ